MIDSPFLIMRSHRMTKPMPRSGTRYTGAMFALYSIIILIAMSSASAEEFWLGPYRFPGVLAENGGSLNGQTNSVVDTQKIYQGACN